MRPDSLGLIPHTPSPKLPFPEFIRRQWQRQVSLGRSATQVHIFPTAGLPEGLTLFAGPRTVLIRMAAGPFMPWHQLDTGTFVTAMHALHAQVLEDAQDLPLLLAPYEHADPERPASRAIRQRLWRMLSLRSLLELSAAWVEASGPQQPAPGWSGRAMEWHVQTLPWGRGNTIYLSETWHLHDLRRWHWPRPGVWAKSTAQHLTGLALLQADVLTKPLSYDVALRCKHRKSFDPRYGFSTAVDLDPEAFTDRVRRALETVIEPALLAFAPEEVQQVCHGKNAQEMMQGLLPGVAPRSVLALTRTLRKEVYAGGHCLGDATQLLWAAGPDKVRRTNWALARAGQVSGSQCLAVEAVAGPLHRLVPDLSQAGPLQPYLSDGRLNLALEEVTDLFSALAALPSQQDLPLPELAPLLTSSGQLRLGTLAAAELHEPQDFAGAELEEQRYATALALIPGLPAAVQAVRAISAAREQQLEHLRIQACQAAGLQDFEWHEDHGDEKGFELTPSDYGLERVMSWSGGIWHLQVARHPRQLVADGRRLSHCVGWGGYAQAVQAGRCRIIRVLAHGNESAELEPVLTIELRPDLETGGWAVTQAKGLHNRLPNADEEMLLALWAQEVGVKLVADVSCMPARALRAGQRRLALNWLPIPSPIPSDEPGLPESQVSSKIVQARTWLAQAKSDEWTPTTRRRHQESLRRIALMVDRARSFLKTELVRMYQQGETRLVGTLDGDALLPGVGVIPLPGKQPELFQPWQSKQGQPGLGIQRSVGIQLNQALTLEVFGERLELSRGRMAGHLLLNYQSEWGHGSVASRLTARDIKELLSPLVPNAPGRVPPRRTPPLMLLRAILDEELGEQAGAATGATEQPGATLRLQFQAWLEADLYRSRFRRARLARQQLKAQRSGTQSIEVLL